MAISLPPAPTPVSRLELAPLRAPASLVLETSAEQVDELRAQMERLEPDAALAHWRTSLDAGAGVVASRVIASLDTEVLRQVWRDTPAERWLMGDAAARLALLLLREEALPVIEQLAASGQITGSGLLGVRAAWVALPMARLDWRIEARRWLVAHRDVALPALVHGALAGADADRPVAQAALRWLARRDGGAGAREAARTWGADAERVIEEVLSPEQAAPPLFARPLPKSFAKLPPVRLRSGEALDATSMQALGRMIATPLPPEHPAMRDVMERCDPASLAALGKALFDGWVEGRMATQNAWIPTAYATLGGDEAVRELGRWTRKWARAKESHERRAARQIAGVLGGSIGSDAALAELATLAATAKDASVAAEARSQLERIAVERGEEPDDLATPRFEPEATLDYGPRSFRTRLSAALALELVDARGEAVADLPRHTKSDDAEKAKAAKEAWKELREAARDAVRSEVARLEHAMITERRWAADRFRARVLSAPVPLAIAQRVLWGAWREALVTFRVAEDGTFASIDDEPLELPAGAQVGVVHPIHLDEATRDRWRQRLTEYELLAPFPQLERPVHRALPEVEGLSLHPGAVLGLRDRGWQLLREHGHDVDGLARSFAGGSVRVDLAPGFSPASMAAAARQELSRLRVSRGALSAIETSEIGRDLVP